jgi:hypothetical protein
MGGLGLFSAVVFRLSVSCGCEWVGAHGRVGAVDLEEGWGCGRAGKGDEKEERETYGAARAALAVAGAVIAG